jgi:hypothetical protein
VTIVGLSAFGFFSKENDDGVPAIRTEQHWLALLLNPVDAITKWVLGPRRSLQLGDATNLLVCLMGLIAGLSIIALSFWLELS